MPPKKGAVDPPKLILYKIKTDENIAPHISNGILTLTLCKPRVRQGANRGDYVLAIVADTNEKMGKIKKNFVRQKQEARKRKDDSLAKIEEAEKQFLENDKYWLAAYLFRVEDIVTMQEYESWCSTHNKSRICTEDLFSGDCQYFGPELIQRKGPHPPIEKFIITNRSGKNALISRHYAAWTSDRPYLLSPEQRANLQLDDDELKVLGVGQTYIDINKKREPPITEAGMVACFRQAKELIHKWQEANRGSVASAASAVLSAESEGPSAAGAGPRASATLFSNNQMAELEKAFLGLSAKPVNKTAKSAGQGGRRKTRRLYRITPF